MLFGGIILWENKSLKARFLGAFILTLSLSMVHHFLMDSGFDNFYKQVRYLPISINLFIYTFLYFYVFHLTHNSAEKNWPFWVFYPALLDFSIQLLVFFMPYSKLNDELFAFQTDFRYVFNILWSVFLAVKMVIILRKRKNEVAGFKPEYAEMQWILYIIYAMLSYEILAVFYVLSKANQKASLKTIMAFYATAFMYWVSLKVFLHYKNKKTNVTQNSMQEPVHKQGFQKTKSVPASGNYDLKQPDFSEYEALVLKASKYIEETELYKKEDITILDVSKALETHPRKVSKAINAITSENFNAFINKFRILAAKKMLQNPKYASWSIEGIGQEVGFKSKSSFYTAFKKNEHKTPLQYKQDFSKND